MEQLEHGLARLFRKAAADRRIHSLLRKRILKLAEFFADIDYATYERVIHQDPTWRSIADPVAIALQINNAMCEARQGIGAWLRRLMGGKTSRKRPAKVRNEFLAGLLQAVFLKGYTTGYKIAQLEFGRSTEEPPKQEEL